MTMKTTDSQVIAGRLAIRDPQAPNTDPRKVGGVYRSAFWRKSYTVTAIVGYRFEGTWEDGRPMRHATPWDWDRDLIISEPHTQKTISDGCMYRTWHYADEAPSRVHRQIKRRPADMMPDECSWRFGFCPDHPSKVVRKVGA